MCISYGAIIRLVVNPFLFIIGLSCPSNVQTSLLKILPVSSGDIGFLKKNPSSSTDLEIRLKVSLLPVGPSAKNSAEGSCRVWQPYSDSNIRLAHFF